MYLNKSGGYIIPGIIVLLCNPTKASKNVSLNTFSNFKELVKDSNNLHGILPLRPSILFVFTIIFSPVSRFSSILFLYQLKLDKTFIKVHELLQYLNKSVGII